MIDIKNYINQIIQGDCLEVMKDIPDKSVDMILCDLPYGTTACKWDTIIPFEPLWVQYKRLIKDNGAIVLTASQPFTTSLIASNMAMFKYCWVWDKVAPTGHLNAKIMPLKIHEDIVVFGHNKTKYYPLMKKGRKRLKGNNGNSGDGSNCYGQSKPYKVTNDDYYPVSIIKESNAIKINKQHPTQKPVALFEYLIRTYTNEGEIVLDNCIGSGTTAIAALNTGRFFIGIEKEEEYCNIARQRIDEHNTENSR